MPVFDKKNKEKEKKILELTGNIVLKNEKGMQISETSAKIVLDKENFSIFPEKWGTHLFSYREIIDLIPENYQLKLSLGKGQELLISQLGYQYEDFVRIFIKLRNEVLLKDLLFQETLKKSGIEADFVCFERSEKQGSPERSEGGSYLEKSGAEKQKGKAEFKFYQTSLVILPERGELMRIPFSDIIESKTDDFQIVIGAESGEKIIISKLGEKFDLFKETLRSCLNEISLNIQNFIKEIWPEIDFSTLNEISGLIKEGKAVNKKDIEEVSPEFWQKLEAVLMKTEVKEEYDFLKSIGEQDKIYIGFKKGLMGGLSGDYFCFFIPIYSEDKSKPGNAIAFETAGEKEKGRATYFFKILSREEYREIDKTKIDGWIDDLISRINRGLLAINFRREPIYLPEEKLEEPEYAKYKFSMAKIPEIKLMRELFIGRVIHKDNKQWQENVMDLLKFNTSIKDDKEKWSSFAKATEDEQKIEEAAESETKPSQENEITEEPERESDEVIEESEREGEEKEKGAGDEMID